MRREEIDKRGNRELFFEGYLLHCRHCDFKSRCLRARDRFGGPLPGDCAKCRSSWRSTCVPLFRVVHNIEKIMNYGMVPVATFRNTDFLIVNLYR